MTTSQMRPKTSTSPSSSRQQRRLKHLTQDPNGPQMRRLDLLVSKETYANFERIMDETNLRRREAIDLLIGEFVERMEAEADAASAASKGGKATAKAGAKTRKRA